MLEGVADESTLKGEASEAEWEKSKGGKREEENRN